MSAESDIIAAIVATGLFTKVRYLVAESDSDEVETILPIFVLADAGRNFTAAQTFCDASFCIRNYEATILATTASECRSLEQASQTALQGIATVTNARDSYDDESGAFVVELSLTY